MANANQVIINGKTILDLRSDTVTPETLQKGYTAHDKSGTKITGTLEASSSGGAKETWVIKSSATGELATTQISFTSNGQKFTSIGAVYDDSGTFMILRYDNNEVAGWDIYGGGAGFEFDNEAYRKLTFDTSPAGALLTWLQANATRQVVEYLTTETDLIKVANAIRAKSGTTAKLSFPDGFALAISNISTVAPGSNYGLITYNGSELTIS